MIPADCPSSLVCLRLPPSHQCWLQTELWQQVLCAADKPHQGLRGTRCATPGAWRTPCLFSSHWPRSFPAFLTHPVVPRLLPLTPMSRTPGVSPLLLVGVRTVTGEPICHQEQCTHDSPMRLPTACPTPSHHSKPPTGRSLPSGPQAEPRLQLQAPCGFVLSPGYTRPSATSFYLNPL